MVGREWLSQCGKRGRLPEDGLVVASDGELSELLQRHREDRTQIPPVALTGGDLWRTLGGPSSVGRWKTNNARHLQIDLGAALVDGRFHWFCAHLVVRTSWLYGKIFVAANAAYLGSWNIAPRAHPGDGLLDVLESDLILKQRIGALRRLKSGTHVPHPDISYRRVKAEQVEFLKEMAVYVDGKPIGKARRLSIRSEPESLLLVI